MWIFCEKNSKYKNFQYSLRNDVNVNKLTHKLKQYTQDITILY